MVSSSEPQPAGTAPAAMTAALRAERIRTLYRQHPALIIVNPINAAIVAALLWTSTPPAILTGWVAVMLLVTTLRVLLRRRYLDVRPGPESTEVWARRIVVGAAATGLLWGAAGALFYDAGAMAPQTLLVFVIGGMVAGASGTLALHLPAFFGFTISAVLPTALRMISEGDWLHAGMGGLAIVYGVAMSLLAVNTNRGVTEALRLRFEKDDLLASLTRAQALLALANETLEQRVAERGAKLERQAEALQDAQRMESVGLLAGGLAHDFNNLLTVVLGNVETLSAAPGREAAERGSLDEIREAVDRGAALVSQLLAFSRRQVVVPRELDLNVVVMGIRTFLTRLIGEHIELRLDVHAEPVLVKADATQIQQLVINLATNARDAMPAGGRLTIATMLAESAPSYTASAPGPYAVLAVEDTGVGMDSETRRMAFHPFFTTKEVGRGTGLGLATVYGIVEQNGGRIVVDSLPGQGSRFRIFLPRIASGAPEANAAAVALPVPPARAATILVVEDEAPVRAITTRHLTKAGYSVLEAQNGAEALAVSRRLDTHIDLVVSDVVMAKLGGIDLAAEVTRERPGIPILLVSGYSREGMPSLDEPGHVIDFLQKPFTSNDLLDKVAWLLARSSALSSAAKSRES